MHRSDGGLIAGGAITFGLAYLVTGVIGTIDATAGRSVGLFTWLPLAGPVLWAAGMGDAVEWVLGSTSAALQTLGLVLLIAGAAGHDVEIDASEALVLPGAPGADVGATLHVRF
ncbi:hypothetical protein [Sandaracinus amylolyticus]|uniref:hypothetical protein n=1 Tax=Sandaracinus amylolyticus TaxID=927083 RepID=UPI001F468B1D|nr:hypothetical protein [Sandaracinus amylolyticus]